MSRRRPGAARRGFTLIELLIGSAVMVVILTGAAMVLLAASSQHRRGVEKVNMERACSLLLGQMEAELRQAGLGIPSGANPEEANAKFPASILVANPNDITFVADLSRPNSSFNGISQLSDSQPAGPPAGIAILNELNGTCDVDNRPSPHCQTSLTSALFPGPPAVDCWTNLANSTTCPWALRKYQPLEWIFAADGTGKWVKRQLKPALPLHVTNASRHYLGVPVVFPVGFFPSNVPNRGFISSPDRVYYRLNAGRVERQQCWDWSLPGLAVATVVGFACNPPALGTDWEPRVRDVAGLTFEYRDAADAVIAAPVPVANLRLIRRVVINLALQRIVDRTPVTASATASATVRL